MFSLPSSVKIYLSTKPTDMRKGFYSLSALVKQADLDVYSGHLFVFINRNRDKLKVLTFSKGGFLILYKSLEKGKFKPPPFDKLVSTVHLDSSQLTMLLDGLDLREVTPPKHWQPPLPKQSL